MWQKHHITANSIQFPFYFIIHIRAFPIVAMEYSVKVKSFPSFEFVHILLRNDFIYITYGLYNSLSLLK